MPEKKTIRARDIVIDIRAGISDAELMDKYRLTARGLQSAFNQLIEKKAISVQELCNRPIDDEDTVTIEDMRRLPRHYLTVSVPIYEPTRPQIQGELRDLTERGIGVIGIESQVSEIKSFVIPCRKLIKLENIWFEAECLWANSEIKDNHFVAGFQITKISEDFLVRLRQLINYVTLK
jgi:hypothetical protein